MLLPTRIMYNSLDNERFVEYDGATLCLLTICTVHVIVIHNAGCQQLIHTIIGNAPH